MFRKIVSFTIEQSNLKTWLIALTLYLLTGGVLMPYGASRISEAAGHPVGILDLQFSYDKERVIEILSDYSERARTLAAIFNATADSFYPVIYALLFIVTVSWIFKNVNGGRAYLKVLLVLPILIMLVDYMENSYIISLLNDFPKINDTNVLYGSLFTTTKWSLVFLQLGIILSGLILLIWQKARAK
jgi:hypothetical protein